MIRVTTRKHDKNQAEKGKKMYPTPMLFLQRSDCQQKEPLITSLCL